MSGGINVVERRKRLWWTDCKIDLQGLASQRPNRGRSPPATIYLVALLRSTLIVVVQVLAEIFPLPARHGSTQG